MGSEWKTLRLGDLGKVVTGKTPSKNATNAFGEDIPFVTPRDMNGCRIIESTERSLSVGGAQTIRKSIVPPNSVAVSCIGSDMGKVTILPHKSVTNQQINTIIVDDDYDFKYVYYDLSRRKEEIRGAAGGSAQPILNKSHFSDLPITLPPLPEQRAIAHILGSLDDKIELNRRMNATLEGMAQALFKSWFVDFDPVIDNILVKNIEKRASLEPSPNLSHGERDPATNSGSSPRGRSGDEGSIFDGIPDELADRAEVRRKALGERSSSYVTSSKDGAGAPSLPAPNFPAAFQQSESMGWIHGLDPGGVGGE